MKERLHEYNSFRKQISHNNIFCLLQMDLELVYSSKCQKTNGTSKEACEICIFANTLKCVLAVRAHTSHPLIMT